MIGKEHIVNIYEDEKGQVGIENHAMRTGGYMVRPHRIKTLKLKLFIRTLDCLGFDGFLCSNDEKRKTVDNNMIKIIYFVFFVSLKSKTEVTFCYWHI